MAEARVTAREELPNAEGLHARPSTLLVQTANEFRSEITIRIDGRAANGKSIMEVMMLASPKGTRIEIEAVGPDATEAVAALVALVKKGFGEP